MTRNPMPRPHDPRSHSTRTQYTSYTTFPVWHKFIPFGSFVCLPRLAAFSLRYFSIRIFFRSSTNSFFLVDERNKKRSFDMQINCVCVWSIHCLPVIYLCNLLFPFASEISLIVFSRWKWVRLYRIGEEKKRNKRSSENHFACKGKCHRSVGRTSNKFVVY